MVEPVCRYDIPTYDAGGHQPDGRENGSCLWPRAFTLEECLRNGIWDHHIKASLSTSIVGSLVGGVLSAVVMMFATHSLAVAGVTGVITVVFTFTLMQAAISEYKKRHQELENAPEETDEQK